MVSLVSYTKCNVSAVKLSCDTFENMSAVDKFIDIKPNVKIKFQSHFEGLITKVLLPRFVRNINILTLINKHLLYLPVFKKRIIRYDRQLIHMKINRENIFPLKNSQTLRIAVIRAWVD